MKKTVMKIVNIVIDILIVFVLIISAFIAVISVSSSKTGVPNLFGYAPMSVQSESMEPTFNKDDLIIAKIIDENVLLKEGDIVTFKFDKDGYIALNSHRIESIKEEDGVIKYYTKGDNNPAADEEPKTRDNIVAVYTNQSYSGLGAVLDILRSQTGFFLAVLLPMILFFIYEAIRVVRNVIAYNKEKAVSAATKAAQAVHSEFGSDLTDEQMKEAVKKYMAEQTTNEQSVKDDSVQEQKDNSKESYTAKETEADVEDNTQGN